MTVGIRGGEFEAAWTEAARQLVNGDE